MTNKQQDIKERLNLNNGNDYCVTVDDILKAANRIKLEKSDGEGMNSDHIINGPRHLFVFNCMLTHGFSPDSMTCDTMVPIPKCKLKQ